MSTSTPATSSTTEVDTERVMCIVKWFDSKKGWGFARTLEQPLRDIFVHHKAITVATEQYRYLVQGEYVELDIVETTEGNHQYQADNVSGIKGGALMCETREVARAEQNARQGDEEDGDSNGVRGSRGSRSSRGPRSTGPRSTGGRFAGGGRGRGPRDGDEYILVRKH